MRINLRYQLVLFSDLTKIQNDIKTRDLFLASWQSYNFVVKPLLETNIGPTGIISNQSRPSFSTSDGFFSVNIHSDKIVIEAVNPDINVFKMISMADFIDRAVDVCSKSELLSSQMFKRVGLIRQMFYQNVSLKEVYHRFCNGIKYFDNLDMNDWSIFFPAHKETTDGRVVNVTSRIEHIKTIVRMDSVDKSFDGIASLTDINTLATNRIDNINWETMKVIIKDLKDIEYDITNQTADAIEENK